MASRHPGTNVCQGPCWLAEGGLSLWATAPSQAQWKEAPPPHPIPWIDSWMHPTRLPASGTGRRARVPEPPRGCRAEAKMQLTLP